VRAPILTLKRARSLRRKMTLPEVVLWQELRGGKLRGLQFRRQHPIGPYILDFYCSVARLAIEIDGASHANDAQAKHDERRDRWLRAKGITVLRVGAANILRDEDLECLLNYIAQVATPLHRLRRSPPARGRILVAMALPLRSGGEGEVCVLWFLPVKRGRGTAPAKHARACSAKSAGEEASAATNSDVESARVRCGER
jgi:very-short-patch-repair endonuclease